MPARIMYAQVDIRTWYQIACLHANFVMYERMWARASSHLRAHVYQECCECRIRLSWHALYVIGSKSECLCVSDSVLHTSLHLSTHMRRNADSFHLSPL